MNGGQRMRLKITYGIQTGMNKNICEDALLCGDVIVSNRTETFYCNTPITIAICDGVGGNAGGEKASSFVLTKVQEITDIKSSEDLKARLIRINEALISYGLTTREQEKMATTLTGVFLQDEHIYLAHCGNTRLYTIKGNYLKQMTIDHSTYQWLLSLGKFDEAEGCNKSEILSAFGGGSSNYISKLSVEEIFGKGMPDTVIITSDGIHDYVSEDAMEEIIIANDSEEKVDKLISQAINNGSFDDCTVVIIEKVKEDEL